MTTSTLVRRARTITHTPVPTRSRLGRRRPVRALRRPVRAGRRAKSTSNTWGYAAAAALGVALMSGTSAVTSPAAAPPPTVAGAPSGFTGGPTGCVVDDPTTTGCLTAATAHTLAEIDKQFGGYRKGPKILSAGCWDAHAWNPTSDHPKGRACDFFFGKAGAFPAGAELAHGWELANWLRNNAGPLRISYVIWQGRIWQAGRGDSGGWGAKYSGGGIYNAEDATGGHYDHVHVSFAI